MDGNRVYPENRKLPIIWVITELNVNLFTRELQTEHCDLFYCPANIYYA